MRDGILALAFIFVYARMYAFVRVRTYVYNLPLRILVSMRVYMHTREPALPFISTTFFFFSRHIYRVCTPRTYTLAADTFRDFSVDYDSRGARVRGVAVTLILCLFSIANHFSPILILDATSALFGARTRSRVVYIVGSLHLCTNCAWVKNICWKSRGFSFHRGILKCTQWVY